MAWFPRGVGREMEARFPVPPLDQLTSDVEIAFRERELRDIYGNEGFLSLGSFRRLDLLVAMVRRVGSNLKVLDVGCAQGNLAILLAEAGHEVVACDIRRDTLAWGQRRHKEGRITWVCGNAVDLSFADDFDLVIMGELLEHVAHPDRFLGWAGSVLKPGGHVLITTPNWDFSLNRLPSYHQVRGAAGLEAKQFTADGDGHLFLFTSGELKAVIREAGFKPGRMRYLCSPFVTGCAKFRYIGRYLPVVFLKTIERLVGWLPWVRRKLCEGLAVLARRDPASDENAVRE